MEKIVQISSQKAIPIADKFIRGLENLLREDSPSGVQAARYSDEMLKHLTGTTPLIVVSLYQIKPPFTTYEIVAGTLDRIEIDRTLNHHDLPAQTDIRLGFEEAYAVLFTPRAEARPTLDSDFGSKDPVLSRLKAGMKDLREAGLGIPTYAKVHPAEIVMRQNYMQPDADTDNTLYMLTPISFRDLSKELRSAGIS